MGYESFELNEVHRATSINDPVITPLIIAEMSIHYGA